MDRSETFELERKVFKSIDPKLLSFITTNYDDILEKQFSNREVVVSNNIELGQLREFIKSEMSDDCFLKGIISRFILLYEYKKYNKK